VKLQRIACGQSISGSLLHDPLNWSCGSLGCK
jgi:hypothetical protein